MLNTHFPRIPCKLSITWFCLCDTLTNVPDFDSWPKREGTESSSSGGSVGSPGYKVEFLAQSGNGMKCSM